MCAEHTRDRCVAVDDQLLLPLNPFAVLHKNEYELVSLVTAPAEGRIVRRAAASSGRVKKHAHRRPHLSTRRPAISPADRALGSHRVAHLTTRAKTSATALKPPPHASNPHPRPANPPARVPGFLRSLHVLSFQSLSPCPRVDTPCKTAYTFRPHAARSLRCSPSSSSSPPPPPLCLLRPLQSSLRQTTSSSGPRTSSRPTSCPSGRPARRRPSHVLWTRSPRRARTPSVPPSWAMPRTTARTSISVRLPHQCMWLETILTDTVV